MSQERIYSARPINTYTGKGAEVGDAYVAFLNNRFPDAIIVDPGNPRGEISRRAKELVEQNMIDPATGERSEKYFSEHGSKFVMAYFTDEVVEPCTIGTGLLLPVLQGDRQAYAVGVGVAAEMKKMDDLLRPTWLTTCTKVDRGFEFAMYRVTNITLDEGRGTDTVSKKPLYLFHARSGVFHMLSVNETRARMYTPRLDGTWDRDNLQSYFLD
ncbi:hypothetical protein A2673_01735 [Candidatus Kaiserbacteria bacterium RIFCSPHIGHO2_01_FULL_50_13]|uniref:Uncharacterized protein n=1 Tax=Candidatus Kaiserbacteria bacterium RIFCSPLOWO2_01_FULL_50_24 TaxID=1798507 RepID=A0A1F6EII8_9BACT|nr:MAG: hypothetical protein A2673_01735 [Candidatus Kaiserbacteria bacterium RIFCSPHIGHO2_01_FULL_50_13]OGG73451.1 MAG: hypothetical protein A3A34_02540 [Candidatus Kaiserbacteria bacterium RIFCSPLOWO2_01_FULL_50_24]